MSAIAGIIGKGFEKGHLIKMLEKIKHRGPDNSEVMVKENCGVAAGELSLSNRSASAITGSEYPLIVMDADIYNSIPNGQTNVEFLRELYLKKGKNCFSLLDGSFSCAIMDYDETILARDPVGARPLMYQHKNDLLYFASEAKSLIDHVTIVDELPPGYYYSTKEGLNQYNAYEPEVPDFESPEKAARILEELFTGAVRKRMDDGAVKGISLSGGLDSSITASVAKSIDPDIKLFSITVQRYPGMDIQYAKMMAEYLDLEHHIYEITAQDVKAVMPEAVWYLETFDEDCISGAIANLLTSRMISDSANCVLVGEGADELFGGYFRELKYIPDAEEKERIAQQLMRIAYNTALRRLDRGWLSHSVNYRTPYLAPEVVAFSNKIPMEFKVRYEEDQGREVEKWILRKAFKNWIPEEILNRPKLRFAGGTGIDGLMDELTSDLISVEEFKNNRKTDCGIILNSPKELYYYQLFKNKYPRGYENLAIRWDPFK